KQGQTAFYCSPGHEPPLPMMMFNDVYSSGANAFSPTCGAPPDGGGSISADPWFRCAPLMDFKVSAGSAVIDAGSIKLSDLPDTDVTGGPRILDGNGDGDAIIDLGAYEFDPTAPPGNP